MKKFILTKLLSKKFIGWVGATVLLYVGKITDDTWLWVTLAYMGLETTLNLADRLKIKRTEDTQP